MLLSYKIAHDLALIMDIHKNQSIRYQVTVSYDFPLLISGVFGDDPLVSKRHKLNEIIERLANRGCVIHLAAQVWVANVTQKICASYGFA